MVNNSANYFEGCTLSEIKACIYKRKPGQLLDTEGYLLVEIVLYDLDFLVVLNELNIGRINPQRKQQRISKIAKITQIGSNDIYNISSDTWIVYSMTNDDIEVRQLPYKHVYAVLSHLQANEDNKDNIEKNKLFIQLQQYVDPTK
ncbi:hypothetical protein C2G38_2173204 [Gigaspora rosea]|uniref:Uncharacterized protein n=1 Tax=Gigaspora rosea TaxID=44941 RepID=A0A397VL73_9GLOM|nr:hypothetical protein C2G38_2173204 [Gigaspora rosea]